MIKSSEDYAMFIHRLFKDKAADHYLCRSVTFQVTNQCNLRCSYCYEHNKCGGSMSVFTARKCIDSLLDIYNNGDFIGDFSKGLIIDFIGGEPLLEASLIEQIIDYYFEQCYKRNIPLAPFTRFSFATNGQLWFTPEAQHLFKKYHDFLSVTVSIDGVQELHDKYRITPYGEGSFEKAYAAFLDGKNKYGWVNSKMTFTPGSTKYLFDSVKMMINNGCTEILCNYAYEPMYTIEDARNIYFELKCLGDYLIQNELNIFISILDDVLGGMNDSHDNYCGGTGKMLSFAVDGKVYPCVRYMPISIGNEKASKICIGDCFHGIYKTEEQLKIKTDLDSITKESQSPEKCLTCPISMNCGWCSGYNYEKYGTANKRYTGICYAHKGRVLASCYYYCKRSIELGDVEPRKINLPREEVEQIIGKEEADALFKLQDEALMKNGGE